MPKDKRKSVFRSRKEKLEVEHEERVSISSLQLINSGGVCQKLIDVFSPCSVGLFK